MEARKGATKIFCSVLSEGRGVVIIREFRTVPSASAVLLRGILPSDSASTTSKSGSAIVGASRFVDKAVRRGSGQVAQVVERSPEKAGVGGSTPSLATISFNGLADQLKISHL
jgi:hypothetical protein